MWSDPDFRRWADAIFDHPVSEPGWYFEEGFDAFWAQHERPPDEAVGRLTALFSEPAPLIQRYSREQLAQGFWFIAGESSPAALCHTLLDPAVPLATRSRCVDAIYVLFRDLFGAACAGPSNEHSEPLHMVCYMWWDIFPTWGGQQTRDAGIDASCLRVMEKTLGIRVEVCQIAALHGLNHWHLHSGDQVERMIDQFLEAGLAVSPAVREYATVARWGGANETPLAGRPSQLPRPWPGTALQRKRSQGRCPPRGCTHPRVRLRLVEPHPSAATPERVAAIGGHRGVVSGCCDRRGQGCSAAAR